MSMCRIRVLRCCFDAELKAQYIDDPNYGPCPYFTPGQEFYTAGERPEGFGCKIGWKSICDEASAISGENPFMSQQIVCCNDGIRPVIFELTHTESMG